jgi:hypothetical protein
MFFHCYALAKDTIPGGDHHWSQGGNYSAKNGPLIPVSDMTCLPSPMKVNTTAIQDLLSHIMIPMASDKGMAKALPTMIDLTEASTVDNGAEGEE